MKQHAPATARNRDAILAVLREVLPPKARVLEVASGSGEHAVWFARHMPEVTWQPSDLDATARASIDAYRVDEALPNLLAPVAIDVTAPEWERGRVADALVCINMIHISPWEATEGLFRGASQLLAAGGLVYTYGAYRFGEQFTVPSNAEFDASLRGRDARWGVRDLDEVTKVADGRGFTRERVVPMPANNHSIVFVRRG